MPRRRSAITARRMCFDHTCTIDLKGNARSEALPNQLLSLRSTYQVGRSGDVGEMNTVIQFQNESNQDNEPVEVHLQGTVKDGRLMLGSWGRAPGETGQIPEPLVSFSNDPEPVDLSAGGGPLHPLHPISHMRYLHAGQHWRKRLHNPLGEARLIALQRDTGTSPLLLVEVLRFTHALTWNGKEETCLVIEYRGEDVSMRIWVRKTNGKVLCQEADLHGERWLMRREHE